MPFEEIGMRRIAEIMVKHKRVVKEDMVTISKEEYDSLLKAKRMLDELEKAGVDNWEYYWVAARAVNGEEDE